ncbi:hypothetical protein [Pollutimonas sp. M17]|uniref:hypothetical protein n=1 Tax=Pollutimonas sp. M17 TaxID=2962065 RepID=UPI0021F3F9F4|nr:hypothetical protein [Pollutimonas sp. M17]UYO93961.1 hypothetical protein OEG81_01115 [Pollutimonas sp. M17]
MLSTASKPMPASINAHPDLRHRLQSRRHPISSNTSKLPGSSTAWESKLFKVEVTALPKSGYIRKGDLAIIVEWLPTAA